MQVAGYTAKVTRMHPIAYVPLARSDVMVHDCTDSGVYTEGAEAAAVSRGTSNVGNNQTRCKGTSLASLFESLNLNYCLEA